MKMVSSFFCKNQNCKFAKSILLLVMFIGILLITVLSFVSAADTTYWLHNESDSQYTAYKIINTSSPDSAMTTSEAISLNTLGITCWRTNWTTSNFTYNATLNGTWQFYINFSTSSSAGAVAYLFANIYKINQTGARISIANSSGPTNVGGNNFNLGYNWTYSLAAGANTNVTTGQRVGVRFCINVTNNKNQNGNTYWEQNTISKIIVPILSSDSTPPGVRIVYPANATYSSNVTALNYSVSDNVGLGSCFYSLNNGVTNTSISCGTNLTGISSNQGSNIWNIYAYDTSNNFNFSSITFFLDSIFPLASYGANTESNGSFINRSNIVVNVSATDTNFANITIRLYNSTRNLINTTNSTNNPLLFNFTALGQGLYYFNASVYDTIGNLNNTETRQVTVDTINPSVNFTDPSDSGTVTRKNIFVNITVNETNHANMSVYFYNSSNSLLQTNFTTANNISINYTNLGHGQYYVNVSAYDLAGNSNSSVSRIFFVNRTSSIESISASPNPVAGGSSVTIRAISVNHTNNDSLQFFCSENTTSPTSGTTICTGGTTSASYPYNLNCSYTTQQTTTTYTVYCRVYDGDYYSSVVNTTYNTSTTIPTTSIVSVAGDTTSSYYDTVNDGRTDIIVSGDMNMTCKWSSSDLAYSGMSNACTSFSGGFSANCSVNDVAIQNLTTRYVACADILGNGQNSSQNLNVEFYLDYTAPTTSDNSVSSIQAPNYTVAIIEADNVDSNPLTYYCTSSSAGCSPLTLIDNGGTIVYTSANRGINYLRYYSQDFAGNSQTIVNKTININQLPTFISASDNALIIKGGTQVNVSIVAYDADNQTIKLFVCNSNSSTSSGCSSGHYCNATGTANLSCAFTSESDSSLHTWYAFVFDSLNESSANNSLSGSYTTDTTAPVITLNTPSNGSTITQNSVTISITSNESLTNAWYSLNNGNNVTMSNTSLYIYTHSNTSIANGNYSILIWANDSYGNIGSLSGNSFIINTAPPDTAPPAITIVNPLNTSYNPTNFLINITADESLNWAGYTVNNGSLITLSNTSSTNWYASISLADESTYNITIFANDTSNNQNNKTISFYIDSSAPRYSNALASPSPANVSQSVNCSINWQDGFNVSSVIISENSLGSYENHTISFSGTNGGASYVIVGAKLTIPSTYSCKFYATDIAGNTNSTSINFAVNDVTVPVITVTSPSNATYNQANLTISIVSNENLSSAWYSLNGSANVTMTNSSGISWNASLTSLSNAGYNIIFYANDSSNNIANSSLISFSINTGASDTTPPVISIDTISNASYKNSTSLDINITTNENAISAQYILNSGSLTDMSNSSTREWNATLSALGNESTNTLVVYANDSAGNRGNNSITFYVDTIAPRYSSASASPSTANETQNVICNVFFNDTFSLSKIIISENATVPGVFLNHTIDLFSTGYANYTILNVQKGNYTCLFYATDIAGNTNTTSTTFIVNDVTAPVISINSPLNQSYSNANVLFSASSNENLNDLYYTLNSGVLNTSLSGSNKTWSDIVSMSDGSYNVIFYGIDYYGNIGSASVSFAVDVSVNDITPPAITIWSPVNNTYDTDGEVLLNITSDEALSWAGYSNNSNLIYDLGNVSSTNWNKTLTLAQGQHNITFYANDSSANKNSANKSIVIYVDLANPAVTGFNCNDANDSVDVNCSASVSDAVGLSYFIISYNFTGSWINSSQISVTGTSSSVNYNISAGNTTPGNFGVKLYLYDLSGRLNDSSSDTVTISDDANPRIYNITYSPNTTDALDPYVRVNVNATIVEDYNLSSAVLMWMNLSDGSWNSVTMTNLTAITYNGNTNTIFNASFLPGNGTYAFKINATDSAGNFNISSNITLIISNESSFWNSTTVPAIKSFTDSQRANNNTLGILYINNTGDTELNINISIISSIASRFNINYTSDDNASYSLASGGNLSLVILANTTALTGLNAYNISVVSQAGTGIFDKNLYIQSTDAPYLVTTISKYSSSVTKGQTDIELIASVSNYGTQEAQNVVLTWTLPSEFSLTSGNLSRNLGNIPIGTSSTNTIKVSVASSAADSVVNITANAVATGPLNSLDSKEVTIGSPQTSTTTVTSGGSGGGGSAGGSKSETVSYSKIIEIVRGKQDSFDIEVNNKYPDSSLEDLTLNITGFLAQYISVSPTKINRINSKETGFFSIKLKIPVYKENYEENILKAIITGKIVGGNSSRTYTETHNIKLIIEEISREESNFSLSEAEKAILQMQKAGFNTQESLKLLEQAKLKLSERRNKQAYDLSQEIINIRNSAFSVEDLLGRIMLVLRNPKKIGILTGNVLFDQIEKDSFNELNLEKDSIKEKIGDSQKESDYHSITALAISTIVQEIPDERNKEVKDMVLLSIAAFDRGDYALAQERADNAKSILLLEFKGSFMLFLTLYWHFILIGILVFLFAGFLSYRVYQKSSITKKIMDINREEDNIRKLILSAQGNYFSGKISAGEYHGIMGQHQNKIAKITQERLSLRNKRIKMLKPRQILVDLNAERLQVESEIKKLQENFYKDKKISESEYNTEFKILNERLAEIEGEKITLEMLKKKKPEEFAESHAKAANVLVIREPDKSLEISKNIRAKDKSLLKKSGYRKIKGLELLKKPLNLISKIRERKRLKQEAKIRDKIKMMGIL